MPTHQSTTTLALFDLDHTLLPIDSDYEWGCYMAREALIDQEAFLDANKAFAGQYHNGTLDPVVYTRFAFAHLKLIPRAARQAAIEDFVREVIAPTINAATRQLVQKHQAAGDLCVLTSATNTCITAPIARLFDLPVIGPEPALDAAGEMTGELAGPANMGALKVSNAKEWLRRQGRDWAEFDTIYAYSDSENDIPLLHAATHAFATNPTVKMVHYAKQQGWQELWLYPKTY